MLKISLVIFALIVITVESRPFHQTGSDGQKEIPGLLLKTLHDPRSPGITKSPDCFLRIKCTVTESGKDCRHILTC